MVASSSAGFFKLDDGEGQTVEEEHDIGAARIFVFADGELVDREPAIGVRILEINNARLRARGSSRPAWGIRL